MSLTDLITLKRSRDNMSSTLQSLKMRLRRLPEDEVELREKTTRKIEMLKIIRIELKELMKEL